MDTIKKVLFPMGQWRQTFATLILNLMSLHSGVILGDFIINNKFDFKLFMFKDMNMNETEAPPMCESRLKYWREYDRKYFRDGFMDFVENIPYMKEYVTNVTDPIISEYNHRYIRDERVYYAEWMQRILVFCIGAVVPLAVYIGHRFGKKKVLTVSAMLFIIACLPCDAVNISREMPSIGAVMVFGVACAFQVYNVPLYVHEISSGNRRNLHRVIQTLLTVTGLYIKIFKPDLATTFIRTIFNPIVPVLFLIGLQILPESPVWLAKKDEFSAAKRAQDWFQIYEKPSTVLEAIKLTEESGNIDIINDESAKFIKMFRYAELQKGVALMTILMNVFCVRGAYLLISIVNEKIDHWISDLSWIVLLTSLIVSLSLKSIIIWCRKQTKHSRIEPLTVRESLIGTFASLIALIFATHVIMLPFKKISTQDFTLIAFGQSMAYGYLVGYLPLLLATILIPDNITAGLYVFLMIGLWTINWILAETWWWLKLTTDIEYWSFGYVPIFVFSWAYAYFFFTDPGVPEILKEPEEPEECENCNKKSLLEAKETVVCNTVPNENILADTKETIPCIKNSESK